MFFWEERMTPYRARSRLGKGQEPDAFFLLQTGTTDSAARSFKKGGRCRQKEREKTHTPGMKFVCAFAATSSSRYSREHLSSSRDVEIAHQSKASFDRQSRIKTIEGQK